MNKSTHNERYKRQIRLPEFNENAQEILNQTRALIVGAGGLGAPVMQYLAAAGVSLSIYDDDRIEVSNLNRQILFNESDVGKYKAECAKERLEAQNPQISIRSHPERVTIQNARALVREADLVVDCSDGLPLKFLVNDACVVEKRPLVHGAASAFSGQALLVKEGGACLRCLFEGVPPAGTVPTCREVGVLGSTVGVVGAFMANMALQHLIKSTDFGGRFYSFDLKEGMRAIKLSKRAGCEVCGESPSIDASDPEDYRAADA